MADITTIEGNYLATGMSFAIVAARFNEFYVDQLVSGAVDALLRHGADADNIRIVKVPGAFELPLAARRVGREANVDAVIALGVIIRGATPHFDFVAGQAAAGIASVALELDKPVSFGVLTTEDLDQATERSGTKAGNKGADAAITAIEMVSLLRTLDA